MKLSPLRVARALAAAVVAGVAAIIALPHGKDAAGWALLCAGALGLTVVAGSALATRRLKTTPAVLASAGALVVVGAGVYLRSIPADSADIPLLPVAALLLGLGAVISGAALLRPGRA